MNYFLGGDPGKDGAITIINDLMEIVTSFSIPTIKVHKTKNKREFDPEDLRIRLLAISNEILNLIRFAAIEKGSVRPREGVVTCQSIGKGDMLLWASIVWMGIPYERVPPQKWHKLVLSGIPGKDPKGRALIKARQLFPSERFLATDRCTKPHQGLVDSALMAVYAKMTWGT